MWILPKSIILAFAPGTEALTSDSGAASQICAQSLMRRSKPSQSRIFLREWKAGNLMRLRFGAISSRSLGNSFLDWWTSSLEVTPASRSAQPENGLDPTIHDIFGPTSQAAFDFSDPTPASLRTLKGIFRWDSPQSSAIWKSWVTACRGAYSARLNAARLTSENGFSFSLPTPTAHEYKDVGSADLLKSLDRGGRVARRLAALNLQASTGRVKVSVDLLEQMMGVPRGWTECGSSATELCLPQQH